MRRQPVLQNKVDMAGREKRVIVAVAAIGACRGNAGSLLKAARLSARSASGAVVAIRAFASSVTRLVRMGARFSVAPPPTAT